MFFVFVYDVSLLVLVLVFRIYLICIWHLSLSLSLCPSGHPLPQHTHTLVPKVFLSFHNISVLPNVFLSFNISSTLPPSSVTVIMINHKPHAASLMNNGYALTELVMILYCEDIMQGAIFFAHHYRDIPLSPCLLCKSYDQ